MRVDMHVHTAASFDCRSDPDRVVAAAAGRGLDRVCVTDHNRIAAALELKRRYPALVIVGEEVRTAEGVDIIGLWLRELIPEGTPARETCVRIHDQGGLVYVPHPFARGKGGGGRILDHIADQIDIMEAFNARLHDPALNERAALWARAHGLPVGAGSDAHTLRELGRAHVEAPTFADEPSSFLRSLAQGRLVGRASSRLVHLASTYAKLHGKLAGRRA